MLYRFCSRFTTILLSLALLLTLFACAQKADAGVHYVQNNTIFVSVLPTIYNDVVILNYRQVCPNCGFVGPVQSTEVLLVNGQGLAAGQGYHVCNVWHTQYYPISMLLTVF